MSRLTKESLNTVPFSIQDKVTADTLHSKEKTVSSSKVTGEKTELDRSSARVVQLFSCNNDPTHSQIPLVNIIQFPTGSQHRPIESGSKSMRCRHNNRNSYLLSTYKAAFT
jgi:hypothetical protein